MPEALDLLSGDDQWKHEFTTRVLDRGLHYAMQGRVHLQQTADSTIQATCRGSGGNVYRQSIVVRPRPAGYAVHGACSCPVGSNCKHCAAVLYHLLVQARPETGHTPTMPSELQSWLATLESPRTESRETKPDHQGRGVYYVFNYHEGFLALQIRKGTRQANGAVKFARLHSIYELLYEPPKYVMPEDREILLRLNRKPDSYQLNFPLDHEHDGELFQMALDTGRLMFDINMKPVTQGPERNAEFRWVRQKNGNHHGLWHDGDELIRVVLPLQPLYYFDVLTMQAGHVKHDLPLGPHDN